MAGSPQSGRVFALLVLLVPLAACAPSVTDEGKVPFTLEDFVDSKFVTRSFKGTWVNDNMLRFYNSTTRDVILYDVKAGETSILMPGDVLNKYSGSSIDSYSEGSKLVAIAYETIKIYRHSTTSKFVIYDTESKKEYPVHENEQLRTLMWVGNSIVWVKGNNIFYREVATSAGPDIQITKDGLDGIIFNGIPDWVYEEEVLASGSAMWPSPDGSKLAFASFNDRKVNHSFYFKYGSPSAQDRPQYPEVVSITYPKVGTPNPDVRLRVVDLHEASKEVKLVDIPAPNNDVGLDHILYGCFWTGNRLLASWTNRVQNKNAIMSCDTTTGSCRKALTLSEDDGWVDPPTLLMDSKGLRAAAILPNNDRPHLAVVTFPDDNSGEATVAYITSGPVTVLSVLGWDEERGQLYFVQTMADDPAKRHVYRVSVPGAANNQVAASNPQCLTCSLKSPEGNACQYGGGSLSKGFTYAELDCLGPDPAYYALYELQAATTPRFIRMWEDNADVRAKLAKKLRPEYLDEWFPVADGAYRARVRMMLPPGLDKTGKTKYPMLVFVYGGPDSNQVTTAFSVAWGDYMCTSRNVIYVLIDGRGSGLDGRKRMHTVYRKLGTLEIQDQINVASLIKKKYKWVDGQRTAIWGWSYGGFSTAHALAQDKGGVFCCGISVAPVTSFIYYDTIYTERYMGLPTKEDNLLGYNGTDVTRNVENFRHKKYLLIHGNADDNVHYQQSMELSRALEEADILFQQQSYPEEAHALSGVKRHVYHTMDDFWTRVLIKPRKTTN